MEKVISIFRELQGTAKKTEKARIVSENKDKQLLLDCLKFLLDGNIVTGISTKKLDKKSVSTSSEIKCETFSELMDYIQVNNTGRDIDVSVVLSFISRQLEQDKEIYKGMITKKLKLGCDHKTVNKALGYNLIPVWEVQQAYPLSDKNKPKYGELFFLSQKLNGNHGSFYKGKLVSRQGKEFKGLEHIIEDIKNIIDFEDDYFLDGELIRKNVDNLSDAENFQKGTGLINSDISDKTEVEFVIYDIMPVEEFDSGVSKKTYSERFRALNNLERVIKINKCKHIKIVERYYSGTDQNKIQEYLDYADSMDFEGIMLNKDTLYQTKRNNGILKVKSFLHCDVLVKRIELGEGKYDGLLGAVVVDYKGCECGVGSGFTDEQRKYYTENPDEIIGKIVQVKYKSETKNKKDDGLSMQFPIFEIVRTDKAEPSYN